MLYGENSNEPLAHVVAGNGRILLLHQIVLFGVLIDGARQRGAKTSGMRAAVGVRDGVGIAKDLVVVAVVVLHHEVHEHVVLDFHLILVAKLHAAPAFEHDRLWVQELLVLPELTDELLNAELVKILLVPGRVGSLVGEIDLESGIEEGEFAKAPGQLCELELGGDREDRGIRQKRDQRPCVLLVLQVANHRELLRRHTPRKCHVIHLAVARHLHLEPVRERVDTLRTHPMQPPRKLVGALPKLSARVQICQHQLEGRYVELRMDVHRNATPVVLDRTRTVSMQRKVNPRAIAGKMFIDRIIKHLENTVVQTPFIGRTDIHSGPLADTRKALQLVDFGSVVLFGFRRRIRFVGHQDSGNLGQEILLPLILGASGRPHNRFLHKIGLKSTGYRDFTLPLPQYIGSYRR